MEKPQPKVTAVNDIAVSLFRKGLTVTEENMKPDTELVLKMRLLGIRVHDLVEQVKSEETADKLLELYSWYANRDTATASIFDTAEEK